MADFYPDFPDVPSHKLLAYLLEFYLLAQFACLSVDDRPNCGLSES
jgi:hypothetical protein